MFGRRRKKNWWYAGRSERGGTRVVPIESTGFYTISTYVELKSSAEANRIADDIEREIGIGFDVRPAKAPEGYYSYLSL